MGIKHILMPNLGESVTEATVIDWLVKPGDTVKKYDVLLEAQSDKVVTEIPSEYDGVIKEILVEADDTVPIGTELLKMEIEGEGDLEETEVEVVEETEKPQELIQDAFELKPEAEVAEETKPATPAKPTNEKKANESSGARYSPAVVRIAQEKGINLEDVPGSGRNGRITRKDVENFDPSTVIKEEQEVATAVTQESEKTPQTETPAPQAKPTASEAMSGQEIVAADGVRKMIAKNMVRSSNEIPHAWMMVEADVTNIVKLRNQVKGNFKKQEGISLSYFPFFVKAVAQAIKNNPLLNASWDNGNIIYNKDINISIAVATDEHLYVPVIKNADQYSITGIAKEVNRLAEAARTGNLKTEDMQDGTITVNNTGSFGSVQSMGIINHPQAAILQVESIQERFVPIDGGFKSAHIVNLCLSLDHRLLDGLQAGNFLKDVKANLSLYNDEANIY